MPTQKDTPVGLNLPGALDPELQPGPGQGPRAPEGQQPDPGAFMMEDEDGFLIRVPADKIESWQRARAGQSNGPSNAQRQYVTDRILQKIYGSKR